MRCPGRKDSQRLYPHALPINRATNGGTVRITLLLQIIEMFGEDEFLMFATDYPHWDFDVPNGALPSLVSRELREKIMAGNALECYELQPT